MDAFTIADEYARRIVKDHRGDEPHDIAWFVWLELTRRLLQQPGFELDVFHEEIDNASQYNIERILRQGPLNHQGPYEEGEPF